MKVLTVRQGQTIGLSERQVEIVNMIEQRYSRQAIAACLGVSKQTARDLIGGLCDFYGCPTADLPERVRAELRTRSPENSEAT